MATQKVLVYSLDVGQGMSTFVEIYDDNSDLIRTLLFDLGSSKNSDIAGTATVTFLAAQINKRKPKPYIDAVFISHKDSDHVSLISKLLEKLPSDVGVGKVWYGGRYSWYTNTKGNVLTELGKRTGKAGTDVQGFPVGVSDFDPDLGFFDFLWDMDDVTVHLLVANTPHKDEKLGTPEDNISKKPDGDQANSKSLVCYIRYGNNAFAISGDATYPSMVYMNQILGTSKLIFTKMLLLPHHGSRKTTFGLPSTSAPISDEARASVRTFARKMGSKTLIASADTKHSHPSLETTALFEQFADQGTIWWSDPDLPANRHFLTAYQDISLGLGGPATGKYRSFQTTWNVYSTLYEDGNLVGDFSYPPYAPNPPPDPNSMAIDVEFPWGMNWIYTVLANGNISLQGVSSGRTVSVAEELYGREYVEKKTAEKAAAATVRRTAPVRPGLSEPGATALSRLKPVR
jgi:hypothetical protein